MVKDNLNIFRQYFIQADTWEKRRDGIPLDLLDNLSESEKAIAEKELIQSLNKEDWWPIVGLAHLQSQDAVEDMKLLLTESDGLIRIMIANTLYTITKKLDWLPIVIETIPKINYEYDIEKMLIFMPAYNDVRIRKFIKTYASHSNKLIAKYAQLYLSNTQE